MRMSSFVLAATAILLCSGLSVSAGTIAVFGDNSIDNFINDSVAGSTATLVTDAQLATPGFLDAFDAFFYTRPGFSTPGTSLSAAAAANVAAFATGNIVLLNGDFADGVGSGAVFEEGLVENAVNFAMASGNGYIGEYTGTAAALTSNSNGLTALDIISGSAGPLGGGNGGSSGSINLTAAGIGHAVTSGLGFPVNPGSVEFGATISGVASSLILATYDNGNAAIIAQGAIAAVPEPTSMALFGLTALGFGVGFRRRRNGEAVEEIA